MVPVDVNPKPVGQSPGEDVMDNTIKNTTPAVIDKLVSNVVECVDPLRIILFGSAARGDMGKNSDLDLLVVMPEGVHRRRTAQKLYREITGLGVPFDIVVATPNDLEKHKQNVGFIYKSVLKEGKEIYGR